MQLANITFDADDPQRLAAFWSAATNREVATAEPFFAMLKPDEHGTRILFLKVPEEKRTKNRMHVDFRSDDRAAEVARLVNLGATEHESRNELGVNWTVMTDPEGNEFCVAQQ